MKAASCALMVALAAPTLWAADCDALLQALQQQQEPAAAFAAYTEADDNFCFNSESQSENAKRDIMQRWGDELFKEIFAGRAVKLDKPQTERLREQSDNIRTAARQADAATGWQILFLQAMLDIDRKPDTFLDEKMYRRLDSIIAGYLRDAEQGTLSAVAKSAQVDNFMLDMVQAHLLNIAGDKLAKLNKTRGSGDSALTRLIARRGKTRGAHVASSTEQPATAVTPIRFEYDSVRLTAQGETEYRENLGVMQANTTRSIFLIGHTDSKGDADYNCRLSQCRVEALRDRLIADGIPADNIAVAWAGENIPLEFEHAGEFLKNRDIIITTDAEDDNTDDPSRRRVEYEINGNALQEKYSGRFCRVTAEYAAVPCKP